MLNERKLSKDGQDKLKQVVGTIAGDTKRRRKLVKKHGKDAAKIVQGIAVKAAQKYEEKQAETMDQDKIKEAVKDALKNPKKADLNKDGKLSDYEKKRGAAIEKAMAKESFEKSIDEMDDKMADYNSPSNIKFRQAQMKREKPSFTQAYGDAVKKAYSGANNDTKIAALEKRRAQLMRDMEQEAEIEGGPIADRYGDELNKIDQAIAMLSEDTLQEGFYGSSHFENVVDALGYNSITDFFEDNPGAVKAMMDWFEGIPQFSKVLKNADLMETNSKKLTYNNFVQMVRDDMMAGAAPDEYPSDEQVRKDAKYLYNRYLQGASVEDLFEVEEVKGIYDYGDNVEALALTFKDPSEFDKAKKHFESNSDFFPFEINDEFKTFYFKVNDDMDETEFYLNQELEEKPDLQGYYFSTENMNEGIFDRFKKKSSSEERPIGTGTTMDGGFGFASDESYELLKKIAKEKGAELTGMGENERYISFGLATTEDDTYTERDYYYDKETGKIIEKGISKQLPENVNEGDLDLGHQDNEPHMLKGDLYRIGKYAMELYQMVDGFEGQGEVDFPHWWQSKIIKSKDALVGAKHYLDFELKEPQIDAMVDVAAEEDVIDEATDKWVVYDTKTKKRLPNASKIYKTLKAAQAFADKQENAKVASDTFYFDKIQINEFDDESMTAYQKAVKKVYRPKYDGSIQMPSQEEVDAFFKATGNELHYLANKPVMGQEATSNLMPIEPWDAYDYSNWLALTRKRQPTFEGIAEKLAKQLKSR